MRQGEVASKGQWKGSPTGGVKAPKPILLPDPDALFTRRARRLEALAEGHTMQSWLRFMAELARAQAALAPLRGLPPIEAEIIAPIVEAGLPPLAAAGHRRAPIWREGLKHLLAAFDHAHSPVEAKETAARVADLPESAVEALADDVLDARATDPGASLYVAAALQAYFAAMAASLPLAGIRLLPERGLCPCCGATPVSGVVTASGDSAGVRYLHCALCCTAWNHTRAVCVTCGETRSLSLKGVAGDAGIAKAETCGECRTYAKMFYAAKDPQVDPVADDLATLGLDLLVGEDGWSRHAPGLLLRL